MPDKADRGPILAIGGACGAPVKRALDQLLDVFERQVEREIREQVAKEIEEAASEREARHAQEYNAAELYRSDGMRIAARIARGEGA